MLTGLLTVLVSLGLSAAPASAHPLDVYQQSSYLTLGPGTVGVELDLSPGVLVAPAVLASLDADKDEEVTQDEARAYVERLMADVQVTADGTRLPLSLTGVDVPTYLVLQAGYGTLRAHLSATGAPASVGQHTVVFRNASPGSNVLHQINAYTDPTGLVVLGSQQRTGDQQQSTVTYRLTRAVPGPGAAAGSAAAPAPSAAPVAAAPGNRLAGYLDGSLSVGVVVVALLAAAVLGALHALTPGHAKTLMAVYLVGSGGTVRNALTLGAVVTFTHTASVILIGLVALLASSVLVPGVLVPALEIASGLLVLVLGLRLLRQRLAARRAGVVVHDHVHELALAGGGHEHQHPYDHDHDPSDTSALPASHSDGAHSHGGRAHSHDLPEGGITARNLLAMGVSGGLVPCPEALGVMVLAVGLGRTVLGLGLIVSFSLGLAAVLMGLGLLLVRARPLLARFDGAEQRWTTTLPLVSAVIVTVLGLGLVLKGLGADLPQ